MVTSNARAIAARSAVFGMENDLGMKRQPDMDLNQYIRAIPDFPKPGILFRDITPLLGNADAFREAIARLADPYRDLKIDAIAAAEARGFIFAAPMAIELNAGFIPVRKPGKLPYEKHSHSYDLEYGSDTLEMHSDALLEGNRVLVVDDLLATGGTVDACCKLIGRSGATIVGCAFAIELRELGGREKLRDYAIHSLLTY
ncbi:MAG: adenine phosphoribosyltransferase [Pirellulales bacterium]